MFLCYGVQQQCHVFCNYSRSSQCHRRNPRFHFRFGEEWVIRTQSDRANQYVGTDTMCNYYADKIADSKNGKGGVRVKKIISEWIHCPVCGNKTRLQIRADTELKNFPLYCSKCRQETVARCPRAQRPSLLWLWTLRYGLYAALLSGSGDERQGAWRA